MKTNTENSNQIINLHPVHAVYDGVFNAYPSRTKVNIKAPTSDMIYIEDIANSLANICRFGGHSSEPYTVAQHSVLVAMMCPDRQAREGLLHDASEAYTGDAIKPFKVCIGEPFEIIERQFMFVIAEKFQLNHWYLQLIKEYDKKLTEAEHEYLRNNNPFPLRTILEELGFVNDDFCIWSHELSRQRFMELFNHLFKNH